MKSQQSFNKVIKNICKRAKINNEILIERTVGNKVVRKKYKKYQLVSSHTARRSFATNMYLAGVAAAKIMLITGHKTESSFFKYIRISKDENAKELSQHPFFRKSSIFIPMIREAIKNTLKEKEISQRKLAIDLGIDYINFNKFMNNKRTLPLVVIEKNTTISQFKN